MLGKLRRQLEQLERRQNDRPLDEVQLARLLRELSDEELDELREIAFAAAAKLGGGT